MSYHIYTSEGIILKSRDAGEADKIYSFFTKDFGRIDAKAQGIRHVKSKLRYSLSGNSRVRISFVSTNNGYWRLVDAEELEVFDSIRFSMGKTRSILKVFSVVERLIQGQEEDNGLWEKLNRIVSFLEKRDINGEYLTDFRILAVTHILLHLGYIEDYERLERLKLSEIRQKRKFLIPIINNALEQSQL
ncbi:MAG: DNA repair protein RecO [Patescibacteria group bacterium]